jgi:hypothetical protein
MSDFDHGGSMRYRIYDLITDETIGETDDLNQAEGLRDAYCAHFADPLAADIHDREVDV